MVRPACDLNWPYKAQPAAVSLRPDSRRENEIQSLLESVANKYSVINMAPVALHPHDNGSSRHTNSKNASTATTPSAEVEARAGDDGTVDLSSADVIRLEHEFGAHK
jgi:hypothetical protein